MACHLIIILAVAAVVAAVAVGVEEVEVVGVGVAPVVHRETGRVLAQIPVPTRPHGPPWVVWGWG